MELEENLEGSARFVAQVLGFDYFSLWGMNCFEFFRHYVEAHRRQEEIRKRLEKQ
jgi:hypothetical protein